MRCSTRVRRWLGFAPYTDDEYEDAIVENARRDIVKSRRALDETNDASIQTSEKVRLRVAHRKWELDRVLRSLLHSRESVTSEDPAELLRKIVEGSH